MAQVGITDWINGKFEETDIDYKIAGKNILYKNEIEYLPKGVELLCKKIKPKSVLEFGFGKGWTATEFQKQGIQRHVILEPNKENYQMALEWKKQYNTDIETHICFLLITNQAIQLILVKICQTQFHI